jgi:hypothetical protein
MGRSYYESRACMCWHDCSFGMVDRGDDCVISAVYMMCSDKHAEISSRTFAPEYASVSMSRLHSN